MNDNFNSLSSDDRYKVEYNILPTARKWLRTHPGLAEHAASTLAFWGFPLQDDLGRAYRPDEDRQKGAG